MATGGRRIAQSRWWPGLVALGPAAVVPMTLGSNGLQRGGLAPLAVAVVVAMFLGAPVAVGERRALASVDPASALGRVLPALSDLTAALLIGAVAAPFVITWGWTGQLVAALGWACALLAARRSGDAVAAALAAAAAVCIGSVALAGVGDPPWTLLEPGWANWREWLPGGVVVGVLLSATGIGQWSGGPEPIPGGARVAWATTGVATWIAVAAAVRQAARFEASLGAPSDDLAALAATSMALVAAATAVVSRRGSARELSARAALGWLGTVWFSGPGAAAAPFFLGVALPLALAVSLAAVARHGVGPTRWAAAVAGFAVVAATATGPVTLPGDPGGAATVALTLVAAFWYVATRAAVTP